MKKLLLTFLIAFITALGLNATTVTKSSFTDTSGNIDDNISYAAAQGGGTTPVAVKSNEIRIYKPASGKKLGGEITISAANECKINSVTISAGESTAKVNIYLDGSSTATKSDLTFSSKKVSIDGISASSVRFVDVGSARFDIASIEVTYTTAGGDTPGPKVLGNIMYNGDAVPATISLKGGETLTFTSANAVSMTLVVNGDEANKITTLDTGEISWIAPAATEAADQTYALSITSKLDDAVKTANTTVTVAKKPTVETFELLTDLSDVNEENTYILYGVTKSNNGVMSKSVTKGHFDALSSYTLTDNVITIPADATDVAIITLESNNDGKYYLKTQDNKYIQTSTSNASLKGTKSEATAFTISGRDAIAHTISIYSGSA